MHDANEVLTEMGPDELHRSIEYAERFDVPQVVSAADVMLRVRDRQEVNELFLSPWEDFNKLIGSGPQEGELIIVTAKPGVGKTSWMLQWSEYAAAHGFPGLFCELEMSNERLAERLTTQHRMKPKEQLRGVDFTMMRYYLRKVPFYFWERQKGEELKVSAVCDQIRDAVKRYGLKFVVFDNLHFLVRSVKYITTEIGAITRAFKLLSEELGIRFFLVVHPKKMDKKEIVEGVDLKDSASAEADGDWIFVLHRKKRPVTEEDEEANGLGLGKDTFEARTLVKVDKSRYEGGGMVYLYMDGPLTAFFKMPEDYDPSEDLDEIY
jgi:replicative DNA helicase